MDWLGSIGGALIGGAAIGGWVAAIALVMERRRADPESEQGEAEGAGERGASPSPFGSQP